MLIFIEVPKTRRLFKKRTNHVFKEPCVKALYIHVLFVQKKNILCLSDVTFKCLGVFNKYWDCVKVNYNMTRLSVLHFIALQSIFIHPENHHFIWFLFFCFFFKFWCQFFKVLTLGVIVKQSIYIKKLLTKTMIWCFVCLQHTDKSLFYFLSICL